MRKTTKFRELLKKDGVIIAPCAYDALSAKIIEAAGYDLVMTSGYCIHASFLGKPDVGLIGYTEMRDTVERIADAVEIPLLCDGESGYGNAMNLMREIKEYERRGAAGIIFDDEKFPPNCPWVKEQSTISVDEMVGKIKAAVEARTDPDFLICCRSDANSFEEQVERCNIYLEAGADMAKISHMTKEQVERAPGLVKGPLHIGCSTGRGGPSQFTAYQLGDMGYKIVSFIQSALFLNIRNTLDGLKKAREAGTQDVILDQAFSMDEYFKLIDLDKYLELERRFLRE